MMREKKTGGGEGKLTRDLERPQDVGGWAWKGSHQQMSTLQSEVSLMAALGILPLHCPCLQ